jgi:hypothetical protein
MKKRPLYPNGPPTNDPVRLATSDGLFFRGDLDIRIDRDGIWYYHGSPIRRKELACLFSSLLTMDEAGAYWLITPGEKGRIQVDDAPFMAVEAFSAGAGRDRVLSFRTNVDELVFVDQDHPIHVDINPETGEPSPYVTLRERMRAKITRPVYYELIGMGQEETFDNDKVYGVWSSGTFFPMGTVDPDG